MPQQIQGAQRDFSSGEIDVALKRSDDHPARKTGLRQMANARILNSGAVQNRPGRSALLPLSVAGTRVEQVTMSAGHIFKIAIAYNNNGGTITIFNANGTTAATFLTKADGGFFPWGLSGVQNVVYAVLGLSIYVTAAGMRPQVISWDGNVVWSIATYNEMVIGSQKRTPFYRISPRDIAIQPGGQTGLVLLNASGAVFTPASVGTRIRFVGRQILILSYNAPTLVNAVVEESLPGSQTLTYAVDPATAYSVGDEVIGSATGSKGVVTRFPGGNTMKVQLLSSNSSTVSASGAPLPSTPTAGPPAIYAFTTSDTVAGPGSGLVPTAVSAIQAPESVTIWDEEVMNDLRGYPASVFVDQFRLGFCGFPSVPGGILWSAINSPTDLNIGPNPSDAIFEIAPDKVQVFHVLPGPESSEFVFCDHKLYYIKIDAGNPLKPGSVGFQTLSGDGCAQVQPRLAQEIILYANAGRNSVMAIVASGAYYRPFNTRNVSEFHGHLFHGIKAIAVPTADGSFNERYAYVLSDDGTLAVGKYTPQGIQSDAVVGWGPWTGVGSVQWVSAWGSDVLFSTAYGGPSFICEALDDAQYLDSAIFVNSPPAGLPAPPGKGPLWFAELQSVTLMDQGTRSLGTYQVDVDGFLVPQRSGGEDLTVASLVAGQPWQMTVEPFCPDASPGADVHQRMTQRRITRFAAHVLNSTGFVLARLFSGARTPTSPAPGTVMANHRFPAWNQDDDPTLAPPQRETVERLRPLGRSFDPRVAIIKDTPGPLLIAELGIEVSL